MTHVELSALSADALQDIGRRALAMAYAREVESWALDIAKRLDAGEWADEDAFTEAFDEETDGAACVIYTAQAHDVIHASSSSSDALDELAELGMNADDPMFVSAWALLCLRRDIREHYSFPDIAVHFEATDEDAGEDE